jgi:hypothetical protein
MDSNMQLHIAQNHDISASIVYKIPFQLTKALDKMVRETDWHLIFGISMSTRANSVICTPHLLSSTRIVGFAPYYPLLALIALERHDTQPTA